MVIQSKNSIKYQLNQIDMYKILGHRTVKKRGSLHFNMPAIQSKCIKVYCLATKITMLYNKKKEILNIYMKNMQISIIILTNTFKK